MSAVVITPTTGNSKLLNAVYSVRDQTYKNTKHLLIVDGTKYLSDFSKLNIVSDKVETVILQTNTGGDGFNGQRIYAAFPHLVNEDFVFFLDQDNWYTRNHIQTMVDCMQSNNLDWCFSLRNIYDNKENFICEDNCESLGLWPIWNSSGNDYLIDTSCFGFKREFLLRVANLWHLGGSHRWGEDRRFLHLLTQQLNHKNYNTTKQYTLNYRLGGNKGSVTSDYFLEGNKVTKKQYTNYPWKSA